MINDNFSVGSNSASRQKTEQAFKQVYNDIPAFADNNMNLFYLGGICRLGFLKYDPNYIPDQRHFMHSLDYSSILSPVKSISWPRRIRSFAKYRLQSM